MANGETSEDLLKDILRRCGEKDDGTSDLHEQALIYLNKCYQKIISGSCEFDVDIGEPWSWARSQSKITVVLPPFVGTNNAANLTVQFTYNSTAGTFSTAPQVNGVNVSVKGWWIQTTAASEWYQITAHISGATSFTIDSVFNDPTTGVSEFLACQLDFTLNAINLNNSEPGGIQRFASPAEVYRQQSFDNDNEYKVYGIDIREFRRIYPLSVLELGIPTRFCITSIQNGVVNIRFNKYTDIQTRIDFDYIPVPLDLTSSPDSIPIVPREFRDVLVYGPCYWLLTDKADDRAPSYLTMTQGILKAMIMDARKKRDHMQKQKAALIPRYDQTNQKKRITYL